MLCIVTTFFAGVNAPAAIATTPSNNPARMSFRFIAGPEYIGRPDSTL
jgi:hypothetical protein